MRLLLLLTVLANAPLAAQTPPTFSWLIELRPARASFDQDATPEENALVGQHFRRLLKLHLLGEVALAGRCEDEAYGLVLVPNATEAKAREIMEKDPCVAAGVFLGKLRPYRIAMMNGRSEALRRPRALSDLEIAVTVTVPANPQEAYAAWATTEGLKSFFAADARIGTRPGDPYEVFLLPRSAKGPRGGEGCRLLTALPGRMLAFEWRAPPSFPDLRVFVSTVVLFFEPTDGGGTRVRLVHRDFGEGERWRACHSYFQKAWPHVLSRLKAHLVEAEGE